MKNKFKLIKLVVFPYDILLCTNCKPEKVEDYLKKNFDIELDEDGNLLRRFYKNFININSKNV